MEENRGRPQIQYFDSRLLRHYRTDPSQYVVHDDDTGGSIDGIGRDRFYVPFGIRHSADGERLLAVLDIDVAKVPARDVQVWNGYCRSGELFAEDEPAYRQWYEANFEISYAGHLSVFQRLQTSIALVQAVFRQLLGVPLWKDEWADQIGPPLAEDNESYATAHFEVYRVIVEGQMTEALQALADRVGVSLTSPDQSLNSLKELLPANLVDTVHKPLDTVRKKRNTKHGRPSAGVHSMTARQQFQSDMEEVVTGQNAFAEWLGDELHVDPRACMERDSMMRHGPWPRIVGPPEIERKADELNRALGKTIERVEFGPEEREPDKAKFEAIVLHFTDGTAMSIDINTNLERLLEDVEGPSPAQVQVDLRMFWLPAIQRNMRL